MNVKGFHIFVCDSLKSEVVSSVSDQDCDVSLLNYVVNEVNERGVNAEVSCAGRCSECTGACQKGPIMLVHPTGWWYGELDEDKVDAILDAMKENQVIDEYLVH